MLSVAYPAIKQANPKAQVLFGGIAYDFFVDKGGNFVKEFLDDVLAAGGGAYFDIMNIHSYPGSYWIEEMNPDCRENDTCFGPGVVEKVAYVQQKLTQEYGLTKPIMITESGWHSDNPPDQPSSPEIQARFVLELLTQSKAAGALSTIIFSLTDLDGYPYESGLVSASTPPQPKPAFTAYQVAVDWLAPARFVRRLPAAELKAKEMDAYEFRQPGGNTFYVAWLNPATMGFDLDGNGTPEVKDNQETIRLPGTTANVYNIYGTLLDPVNGNDGYVKVLIGGQPRIIEIVK